MEKDKRDHRKDKTTNSRRSGQENGQKTFQSPEQTNDVTRTPDYRSILSTDTTTPKNKKRRFQKRKSIINLSTYSLTKGESSILEKGLNFIPTPSKEHEAKIVQDFLLFKRKLRLHHKYHEEKLEESAEESGEEDSPHKLLRPSKGYKPEDHEMDPNIMRYKTTVLNEMKIQLANRRRPRFNTTKEERKAMKTLKTNKDIVIKPADKGGAIVIMNKQDYIDEGMRQLANKDHYIELENTQQTIKQFIKEVKSSLDTALRKEYISEDLHKILVRTHPRTSNLYLLPKIHKKNNPGRPIINSIGSLTETLSAFIDEILRRFSTQSSLDKHKYTRKELAFVCDACGDKFPFQSRLDQHMIKHISNKIRCPVKSCSKSFKGQGDLNRHICTHKKGGWHHCNNCDYKNKDKRNVSSHMRVHLPEGEEPYVIQNVKKDSVLVHNIADTRSLVVKFNIYVTSTRSMWEQTRSHRSNL